MDATYKPVQVVGDLDPQDVTVMLMSGEGSDSIRNSVSAVHVLHKTHKAKALFWLCDFCVKCAQKQFIVRAVTKLI